MATILIIDDYQPLLKLYEKEFKREGYQVVTVEGFDEAIRCIQDHDFDAVIVEIAALRRDEFEILTRSLIMDKRVPIIINTVALDRHAKYLQQWVTKSSDLSPLKERIWFALSFRLLPSS